MGTIQKKTIDKLTPFKQAFNQWYVPQGKPWTHYSATSSGELNLSFSSAVVVREGGLKTLIIKKHIA